MGKRIASRRRGAASQLYRSPSHRHHGAVRYPQSKGEGVVIRIEHDPGHNAPIAEVKIGAEKFRMPAPEGLQVRQRITVCVPSGIERGNIMELGQIPEGTLVYNIEASPGDGGRFVRAPGNSAAVVSHDVRTVVQLPSGQFKSLDPRCRATIGVVASGGRTEKPLGKAGRRYHAYRSRAKAYLKVRGVAMAPVYHPHGGGSHQHVGRPSTVSSSAWPGQKVGRFSPKRKKRK